jgi:hypothetical protein
MMTVEKKIEQQNKIEGLFNNILVNKYDYLRMSG